MTLSTNQKQQSVIIPIKSIASKKQEATNQQVSKQIGSANVQSQQMINSAKLQANQIINEAEHIKQKLLNDVKSEIESTKEVAYQNGYKEGYLNGIQMGKKDGKKQVISESRQYIEQSRDEWINTQSEVKAYLESIQPMIANMIQESIETIMMQQLEDGTLSILPVIKEMLQQILKRKQIFIRLHPGIYEMVKQSKDELDDLCESSVLKLYEDSSLSEYGCLIETESEKIDLQLDKQLDNLFKELKQLVG